MHEPGTPARSALCLECLLSRAHQPRAGSAEREDWTQSSAFYAPEVEKVAWQNSYQERHKTHLITYLNFLKDLFETITE